MSPSPSYTVSFKWGALAIAAITFLSLMPQLRFCLARGSQWRGSYIALQDDEIVYSAYVNALIDGRPRRTDPSAGLDDHPQSPLPESLFSVQFVPPLVIAWLARVCGASASSAFIALIGIAGFLTSLSLFWLFSSLTGDRNFSAVGILIVLCFGALAGGYGIVGLFLGAHGNFLGLPFLRRYEPAAPLPLFFVFCALIWYALATQSKRAATAKALLAGTTFGILIFSYFYLWTAAAAWVVCVACLWLLFRPGDRRGTIRLLLIAAIPAMSALAVYAHMLSNLPPALNEATILTSTRRPDLLRIPEIIGAFTLVALIVCAWRNKVSVSTPRVIFAASFALLPFMVFNQQLLTGRSVQPFHYEVYIVNYVALLGLVMIFNILQPAILRRTLLLIVSLCLLWAMIEVNLPFQVQHKLFNEIDEMVPVLLRLKEEAKHDGTWEGLRTTGKTPGLVFSPQYGISQLLPLWAPQGSLLAPGSEFFQGPSEVERKERLFTHFYYCGKNQDYLRELLNGGIDPFLSMRSRSILFGVERVSVVIGSDFQPIRPDEIEQEVKAYEVFTNSFSSEQAGRRPLIYAVTRADSKFDFSHIDLWYERDAGQQIGAYILYRLRQRF
jgi:hypothetical protein